MPLSGDQQQLRWLAERYSSDPDFRDEVDVSLGVRTLPAQHRIVCVCGSMRYYNHMLALANELTLGGKIVLLPFVLKEPGDSASADMLQALHHEKIGMSDEVIFLSEGQGYGESTAEELEYAQSLGKAIEHIEFDRREVIVQDVQATE